MSNGLQRVLITGASSGIGLALVQAYLQAGWQVFACGRNQAKLHQVLGTDHSNLSLCVFDMDNREAVLASLGALRDLDLVILNAGVCEYIDDAKHFDSVLMERVMGTNVMGTSYCLDALLPNMVSGSRVGLVSSIASQMPFPRAQAYGASKAAVDYLARSLSMDLAPEGIDVCLIRPGFVETPLTGKNDFPMPGIVDSQRACREIMQGLAKGKREISFPKRLVWPLRIFSALPSALWRALIKPHKPIGTLH